MDCRRVARGYRYFYLADKTAQIRHHVEYIWYLEIHGIGWLVEWCLIFSSNCSIEAICLKLEKILSATRLGI